MTIGDRTSQCQPMTSNMSAPTEQHLSNDGYSSASPQESSNTNTMPEKQRTSLEDFSTDPSNPLNWPKSKKWFVTLTSCFMCFIVGWNSLSITSASVEINQEFNVSDEHFANSFWAVTVWNTAAAIAPMIGLPLMENFGVRVGYLTSYVCFTIFIIPQAVARNYATLLVARAFGGLFAGVAQIAVANIIGDCWAGPDSSLPVSAFILAYLAGLTLGPVVGSGILTALSWRWIFYIQLIIYGALSPLVWFGMQETRGCVILSQRQKREKSNRDSIGSNLQLVRTATTTPITSQLYEAVVRPAYLLVTEPVLIALTCWSSLAVGNVFMSTQSIAQVFTEDFGFSVIASGYVSGAMVVGEIVGFFITLVQNRIYERSAKRNQKHPGAFIPESRLQLAIPVSFVCLGGGLFFYGWTSNPSLHWILPTVALGFIGCGITVVVQCVATYTIDSYPEYAGSATAAVAAGENLAGAFLPLSTLSMYRNLGFHWASSLLAFLALVLSFAPVVLYLKGPSIRKRSKAMSSEPVYATRDGSVH